MYPRIQSGLIETPAPAAGAVDAPRGSTVLVCGSAPQGPTTPVTITSAEQAHATYGADSELAITIEAVLQGARIGGTVAGNQLRGNVVAIRTETGEPASVTLLDASGNTVMKLTTKERSERANLWTIQELTNGKLGYSIFDPTANDGNGAYVDVEINLSGTPASDKANSPSELADAIRSLFVDQLEVDVFLENAHFELYISSETTDDDSSPVVTKSTASETELDFRGLSTATVAANSMLPGSKLWLDPEKDNAIQDGTSPDFYNKQLGPENEDARIYAITAGKAVSVPAGVSKVAIDHLASAQVIGLGSTNSLLNIRTTGFGAASEVSLVAAGTRNASRVSEGYFRVRDFEIAKFDPTALQTTFDLDGDTTDENVYALVFEAEHGIADEGGALSQAYATDKGGVTADEVSTDRLGTKPTKFFTLKVREAGSETLYEIPLDFSADGSGTGVWAKIEWDAVTRLATLYLHKDDIDAVYGESLQDAEVFVSFDSCVFDLEEKSRLSLLNPLSNTLQYAVVGQEVTFNRLLEHELVIRPLRITHYRLGDTVFVEHQADGNKFTFVGSQQPGEGGGPLGGVEGSKMQVIFGFDYQYEPEFPSISGVLSFQGGTSGVNASVETRVAAIDAALATYKDIPFGILLVSDTYIDDVRTGYDPITGERRSEPSGLLGTLETHLRRVEQNGASGIVYCSVRPMKPSSSTGRITDSQKIARFLELTQPSSDPVRVATMLAAKSYPDFFVFDAPMFITMGGREVEIDGAALFAGIRSTLPNDRSLYQLTLPTTIRPKYRYDVVGYNMVSTLSAARINVWSDNVREVRLADERTAASLVLDARGQLQPSSFQSGAALLASKDFLRRVVDRLRRHLGPMPSSGIDVLRASIKTEIEAVATATVGVQAVFIDDYEGIIIRASGGSAFEMIVRPLLQVNGELRNIDIRVRSTTDAAVAAAQPGIPQAQ
ncbi:MAG: hypothetical protein D6800_03230 [Candidatus Zixiibacteriota bacterium]|nr:MAG: hypothetical protein D6800_03230 [candidate division Zixibacteria bacterium]